MNNEFKRFDVTESDGMRIHIPFSLKMEVEMQWHERIRWRKGITLKDAYLHCAQKALNTMESNRTLFLNTIKDIDFSALVEDKSGKESLIQMPLAISNGMDVLKEELSVKNKRAAFICAVKIGVVLYDRQFKDN